MKDPLLDEAFEAAQVPEAFAPSDYQRDIFDFIDEGEGNAVVEAVAGSGKTTTLIEALKRTEGRVLFCAFNKHIADEIKVLAPRHAQVSTIHSLGFKALRRSLYMINVDGDKMRGILRPIMKDDYRNLPLRTAVLYVAKLAKLTLVDPSDRAGLMRIIVDYDLDEDDIEDELGEVVEYAANALNESMHRLTSIDFDDMVWLPNVLGIPVPKFDWLFVDEAQDLNPAQRELVLKALKKDGRMVAVGDSNQAIYGFAGADMDSISKLTTRLEAKTLPLSICYRCPTSHIDLAKKIVPYMEAAPGAPYGVVELGVRLESALRKMRPGDLVICRINAPLAEIAMKLIKEGRKAVIRGKDISTGLVALVRKMNTDDIYEFHERLVDYRDRQVAKYLKAEKEQKAINLQDRCETLIVLAEGAKTCAELVSRIETIFSDRQEGIVLSSVHRAKGLEADRVFIYRDELLPHPNAKGQQIVQEMNLRYVALTRAKKELWFVDK